MQNCPACRSSRVRVGPESRRTGSRTAVCRDCGARLLADPPAENATAAVSRDEVGSDFVDHYVSIKREGVSVAAWHEQLERLAAEYDGAGKPLLYDVGAGDGAFLQIARDEFGFRVSGNDILEGMVDYTRDVHGIELDLGDLSEIRRDGEFDIVTLWCVLAHVPDGEALMTDVLRVLRPGGQVFLQTPHCTVADRALVGAKHATRGRITRVADRRLAIHHRVLHTRRSITALLERVGFTDVRVEPQGRYPLSSKAYLDSLRVPEWASRPAGTALDKAVGAGVVPRIVLDVSARKPD